MKKIYQYICLAVLGAGIASCTNEDYKLYDTTQKDAVFFEYKDAKEEVTDSVDYVFNYNIATSHTIEIPVKLMGMPVNRERKIEVAPVTAETDMVEGTHYTVESSVLPANELNTTVKVTLLRENDPQLQERSFKLTLELGENDDLRAVGQHRFTITFSDIRPTERPSWWTTTSAMPIYSFEAAQVFFKYFYELAPEANRDVFNTMDARYGEYFVNAVQIQGPFAMYRTFLIRNVLMPMYDDYKDAFEWQAVPTL